MTTLNLFAGPPLGAPESYASHVKRLGHRPAGGHGVIEALEHSGLTGRGGASFPVGTKWRSVASRAGGGAVVVANGAEGEPLSRKDRTLMASRPHLVLDGALIAAESLGADRIYLYVGEEHLKAHSAIGHAIAERPSPERDRLKLVGAPRSYVAGEESAVVHFMNEAIATPVAVPPRPFEKGVAGKPTLVQNVESLAHAATIARHGPQWYRGLGDGGAAGTVLLTLGGAVAHAGVIEVSAGVTVDQVLEMVGATPASARAVLLGGYFGGWLDAEQARSLAIDPAAMRAAGGSLGCGVLFVLARGPAPLREIAGVIRHLAEESAAQCGPCFFGLRSLASATERIAAGQAEERDLERLQRWTGMVRGRGACRHPDGAAAFMESALRVFADDFAAASRRGR